MSARARSSPRTCRRTRWRSRAAGRPLSQAGRRPSATGNRHAKLKAKAKLKPCRHNAITQVDLSRAARARARLSAKPVANRQRARTCGACAASSEYSARRPSRRRSSSAEAARIPRLRFGRRRDARGRPARAPARRGQARATSRSSSRRRRCPARSASATPAGRPTAGRTRPTPIRTRPTSSPSSTTASSRISAS